MVAEKRLLGFLILTFIIIVIMGGVFRIQAVAKENCFSRDTDSVERMFMGEVKEVLAENGAKNSGVTMTKTSEGAGMVTYHVAVNLPKYIAANEEISEKIEDDLNKLNIEIENADTVFSFS